MDTQHNRPSMIDWLLVKCKMLYRHMPARLRFVLAPLKSVYYLRSVLRPDLWIIAGKEVRSEQELTIIYAGDDENRHFFRGLALRDCHREERIGKAWLWNTSKVSRSTDHSQALVVIEIPRSLRVLFRRPMSWFVPSWIHGELDISSDDHRIANTRSLRSDINKIKNSKLSFEVTNDAKDCYDFYYDMHLPLVTRIYRGGAVVMDYEVIKQEMRRCDLVFIRREEERIGGALIRYPKKDKAELWFLGIKNGDPEYIKYGVTAALYYFSILYLREKGVRRIEFGMSRSFLKDGVLQYKRKWGQTLGGISAHGFVVRPLSMSPAVKGFFCNNPFIYLDGTELNGAIFVDEDEQLSTDFFTKTSRRYHLNGLAKLVVFRFGKDDGKTQYVIPSALAGRMTVRSVESDHRDQRY